MDLFLSQPMPVARANLKRMLAAGVAFAAVMKEVAFFSISGLFGYQYSGAEGSVLWIAVVVATFVLSVAAFVLACLRRPSLTKLELVLYGFVGFMLFNHLLWWSTDLSWPALVPTTLVHFASLSLPGILAIRVVVTYRAWQEYARITHVAAVLMALGIVASVLLPFATGRGEVIVASGLSTLGGATAQSASYFAAFVFGLLGFFLFRADSLLRSSLVSGRAARVVELALWACMGLATIVNGGRGGLLLLCLFLALHLYWFSIRERLTYRSLLRLIAVLVLVPTLLGTLYSTLSVSEVFGVGLQRALDVFFFLFSDTTDISLADASSNRDQVYVVALEGIRNAPMLGYGAFGHWSRVIQPHNFLLDLALQFGIPIAVLLAYASVRTLIRNMRSAGPERSFFAVLGLYPLVLVTFSNGYFLQPLLWFAAAGLTISQSASTEATAQDI